MPFSDPELPLQHILDGIAAIEDFTSGMEYAQYQSNDLVRAATERKLQIISESASRLGDVAGDICPEIDWRSIHGMGNQLRHGYDRINDQIIWSSIKLDLPVPKNAVSAALLRLTRRLDS